MDEPQSRRSKRRRRALLAAPLVAVLAIAAAMLLWPTEPETRPAARTIVPADPTPLPPLAYEPPPKPEPQKRSKPKPKPEPKPVKKERPKKVRIDRRAANPVAVSVPSAGISAPTIALGLKKDGALEVPTDFSEAGWRSGGPEPGERGAAMITAHVDSQAGPAAFYSLGRVTPGDEIDVRRKDGSTVTFLAERTEQVSKNNFPTDRVYGDTRLPTLRLVTCGGSFDSASGHYRENLIVYATRKAS